jgi:dolichyl-phosphate beta-glucosyltransferase
MSQKHHYPEKLSLILPLYNEEDRFTETFPLIKKLHQDNPGWEIILVNDGSTDQTQEIVTKTIKNYSRIKLLTYTPNQGKGHAISTGVLAAKKPLILFSDIDFSAPITELELMYPFILKGADIVIGTRKVKGANITKHQASLREFMGKQFTTLTNLILGLNISDFTCGFKLFTKQAAQEVFSKSQIKRWAFDAEVLFLAQNKHYRIVEVPVEWHNDDRTKVKMLSATILSFYDLIKVRVNQIIGRY